MSLITFQVVAFVVLVLLALVATEKGVEQGRIGILKISVGAWIFFFLATVVFVHDAPNYASPIDILWIYVTYGVCITLGLVVAMAPILLGIYKKRSLVLALAGVPGAAIAAVAMPWMPLIVSCYLTPLECL